MENELSGNLKEADIRNFFQQNFLRAFFFVSMHGVIFKLKL